MISSLRPSSIIYLTLFLGGAPPTTIFVSAGMKKTNPCPEVPTLICQHGSFCIPGNAYYGPEHEHLQLQTSESGYHCECNDGYIGHECQISVDYCTSGGWSSNGEQGVPFCYYGAQCQIHKGQYYCDCHTLNLHSASTAIKYDGALCQHPSTSFCATSLVENHAPNFQFCTNDGTCNKWVADGEPHPGCSCLDGYRGDRCEIKMNDPYEDMAQYNNSSGSGSGKYSSAQIAGIVLLVLGIVILIPAIVCLVMRARRRKRRNNLTTAAATVPSTAVFVDGKTVVGEGDLDADGSGTLGSSLNNDGMENNGENGDAHHDDDDLTTEEDEDKPDDDTKDGVNGNAAPLTEIV